MSWNITAASNDDSETAIVLKRVVISVCMILMDGRFMAKYSLFWLDSCRKLEGTREHMLMRKEVVKQWQF